MRAYQNIFVGVLSLIVVTAEPQVRIDAGPIHGTICDNAPTSVFRGIPFAQPPTGSLRFMPPQPFNSTYPGGFLNATQFAPACIQMPGEFAWTQPLESEDCLYLDIYVPPGNQTGLPVKVWAHGGGNTGGTSSFPAYDLCNLATDSVAVAINYRLGPLGFLGLDAAGIHGNMGIMDYVVALEWVQQNIEAFGGDRSKVMLFGQSSGADDTFVVSTLPQAKSLISAAICESGGGVDLTPYATVQAIGASYAGVLNCSTSDLSCLQSRSVDELVNAYANAPILYEGVGTFSEKNILSWEIQLPNSTTISTPFVDGKFITKQPLDVGPQVPIIMGSNGDDGSLFSLPPFFLSYGSVVEQNYTNFLSQFGSSAATIEAQYPLSSFNSSGSTPDAVITAVTHVYTQAAFRCFTSRGLRSALKSGVPAYAYIFDHTPSCPWLWSNGQPFPNGAELNIFGATHTAELPFVFGNLENQPLRNGSCNASTLDRALSAVLKGMWTSMAANGNPGRGNVTWPQYDACSGRGLYVANTTTVQPLDFSECDFWDNIWEEQGGVKLTNATRCATGTAPGATDPTATSQPSTSKGVQIWTGSGISIMGVITLLAVIASV